MIPVRPPDALDLSAGAFRLWICLHFVSQPIDRLAVRRTLKLAKSTFNRQMLELRTHGYVVIEPPSLLKRIDARGVQTIVKSDLSLRQSSR